MSRIEDQGGMTQQGQTGEAAGQMRETAQQVQQNLRDLGGQVRDVAGQKYDQLRQQATDYYQQGRDRAMEMEQSLEQYVQEKPIQSLLIAAGVGMLLGILWRRS